MITFYEAREIAMNLKKDINACHEYEKAYHFLDRYSDADGDCGVVVLKENGKAISFVSFVLNYAPERDYKSIPYEK